MAIYNYDKTTYSQVNNVPGFSYTRSGTAYQQNASGVWTSFDENVPPISDGVGLGVWEARTNSVRNPTGLGAVVGTLGSGGALPTNWGQDVGTGLTWSVVGTGVENGLNYVDLRFAGTPSGTFLNVLFEGNTAISAATGDIWTASFSAKLVAGSLTNVSKAQVSIFERTSGGTYVAGGSVLDFMPGSTLKEYRAARTLNGGGTVACVNCAISLVYTSGAALDLTLRIAAPNLKKGADIGDPPILQTNNAAATRGAAVISQAVNIPVGQAFTVTGKWVVAAALSVYPTLFSLDDGSGASPQNLMSLYVHGDTRPRVQCISAGATVDTNTNVAIAGGSVLGMAVSVSGSQVTYSVNGSVAASFTMPGGAFAAALLRAGLGCYAPTSAVRLDGTVRALNIVMRAYSSAELQAASNVTDA